MTHDQDTFLLHLDVDDCAVFSDRLTTYMVDHALSPEALALLVAARIKELRKQSREDRQRYAHIKIGAFMILCYATNRMKPSELHARLIAEAIGKTLPEMLA